MALLPAPAAHIGPDIEQDKLRTERILQERLPHRDPAKDGTGQSKAKRIAINGSS